MVKRLLGQPLLKLYRQAMRNSKYRSLVIVGSLIYLLSPIDIAPDVLPLVGWIDDGVVATIVAAEVAQILMEQRRRQKSQSTVNAPQRTTTVDVDAITAG